jgi:hypothetical protein
LRIWVRPITSERYPPPPKSITEAYGEFRQKRKKKEQTCQGIPKTKERAERLSHKKKKSIQNEPQNRNE